MADIQPDPNAVSSMTDPYAPPRARMDSPSVRPMARRLPLRILCFVIGGLPGAVLAVGAAFALVAGTAGVLVPLMAWGALGLIGFVAGMTAIFRLPSLSDHSRKLTIGGIWAGIAGLLPLVFLIFSSWQGLLLIAGPAAAAALLLMELYRDRNLARVQAAGRIRAMRD